MDLSLPLRRERSAKTEQYLAGKHEVFRLASRLIHHRFFDNFCVAVVFANVVTLSMDYHGIPESTLARLAQANIVFSTMFLLEMVLKLIGTSKSSTFESVPLPCTVGTGSVALPVGTLQLPVPLACYCTTY